MHVELELELELARSGAHRGYVAIHCTLDQLPLLP